MNKLNIFTNAYIVKIENIGLKSLYNWIYIFFDNDIPNKSYYNKIFESFNIQEYI